MLVKSMDSRPSAQSSRSAGQPGGSGKSHAQHREADVGEQEGAGVQVTPTDALIAGEVQADQNDPDHADNGHQRSSPGEGP